MCQVISKGNEVKHETAIRLRRGVETAPEVCDPNALLASSTQSPLLVFIILNTTLRDAALTRPLIINTIVILYVFCYCF